MCVHVSNVSVRYCVMSLSMFVYMLMDCVGSFAGSKRHL